jgi:selenocysteine-specific elongation factor
LRERGEPRLAAYLAAQCGKVLDLSALARRWMTSEAALVREAAATPGLRVGAGPPALAWSADLGDGVLTRLRAFAEGEPRSERALRYGVVARQLGVRPAHLPELLRRLWGSEHPAAAFLRDHIRLDRDALILYPGGVALTEEEQRIARAVEERLRCTGLRPPRRSELVDPYTGRSTLVERVLAKLLSAGRLVKVGPDFLLHPAAAEELRQVPERYALHGIRAAEFGQALGLSRKYSIPYLEFLHREGVLHREGDLHYLTRR